MRKYEEQKSVYHAAAGQKGSKTLPVHCGLPDVTSNRITPLSNLVLARPAEQNALIK